MNLSSDTIAAIATPPGKGGVGIIRVSGPNVNAIILGVCNMSVPPKPRYAHFTKFVDQEGELIDEGLVLYFPSPNSFTGEDVAEFQGHGGPVVMARLLSRIIAVGARHARAGEFSERAFLNDKIDLAQAEAIADLIDSATEQAAKSAILSLKGDFSKKINELAHEITELRMFVEAAIDFPEEEIDFLTDGRVLTKLNSVEERVNHVLVEAKRGTLLKDGIRVVLAGKPNAGKSSLLNRLAGAERAIVTSVAGTTRDVLSEHIHIDGMPLHVTDTAGLRLSDDEVEQEGIRRAWNEIHNADLILLIVDANNVSDDLPENFWPEFVQEVSHKAKITIIRNKIDLTNESISTSKTGPYSVIRLSASNDIGIDLLRDHIKETFGHSGEAVPPFIARQRHIESINKCKIYLQTGTQQLVVGGAGELLAEDLRRAHEALCEITGRFTPDDLLGSIFSSFCIGK